MSNDYPDESFSKEEILVHETVDFPYDKEKDRSLFEHYSMYSLLLSRLQKEYDNDVLDKDCKYEIIIIKKYP